jgi:two-component system cell cycle sensor histidine kinase/response regulator CckA
MDLILVLEDDPAVQGVLRAVLQRNGFTAEVTASAEDALVLCKHYREGIDLLIADAQIPSGSGAEVALKVRQAHPHVPILFTSGTPIEFWSEADRRNVAQLRRDSFSFIPKPFTCWTLMQKIGDLLTRSHLAGTA